jgi:flavin reductase (DIM6/NTAB) family NADH-FMN oxidoreductase RutF
MPVWVIGTYDREGKPNVMTVAGGMACCRKPPLVGIALREATYTYQILKERPAFTVNIPSEAYAKEADYFGIASGRTEDKFAATGLTPVRSDLVDAPYVEEFPFFLECRLVHTIELGSHTLFIGEILDLKADEDVLGETGFPDIEKLKPLIFDYGNLIYQGIGGYLGKAFVMGKELKK